MYMVYSAQCHHNSKLKAILVHVHTVQCMVPNRDALLYLNIQFYIALSACIWDAVDVSVSL